MAFISLLLLNELFSLIYSNYLSLNFSSINYNKNDSYDLMSTIFNSEIYSNLSIGTPKQTLKMILNGNEQTFYITEKTYNHSLSSTYHCANNRDVFFLDNVKSGLKSNDTGYFNIKTKNEIIRNETCLNYALVYSVKYDFHKLIDGVIGLQLKIPNYLGIPNFIDNLKSNKFINSYQWVIIYSNMRNYNFNMETNIWNQLLFRKSFGELIIGFNKDEYGDIFNINVENYELRSTHVEKDKDKLFWSLFFEDIYLYKEIKTNNNNIIINDEDINKKHLDKKLTEFLTTKEYNIGTKEFQLLINEEFFNYYLENNICQTKDIFYDFSFEKFFYYMCDNTTGRFILENKFPNISFVHRELKYTFELTYQDLFFTDINDIQKNKFYFNIIFSKSSRDKWSLGKPFLKKYFFMFDYDKKLIQFLKLKSKESKVDKNLTNPNIIVTIQYIIISILVIILIILGVLIFFLPNSYLGKYIRDKIKKSKKRANELEDEIIHENEIN